MLTRYQINNAGTIYATYTPIGTTSAVCTLSPSTGSCTGGSGTGLATYKPTTNGLNIENGTYRALIPWAS